MCVRASENVWEWVYVTGSRGLTERTERACGWPATLNVHFGGLIIRDNVSGETYTRRDACMCVCVCAPTTGVDVCQAQEINPSEST